LDSSNRNSRRNHYAGARRNFVEPQSSNDVASSRRGAQLTREEFDGLYKKWWNKLRSPVFNGGKIVTSSMRQKMQEAMKTFVPPMESRSQTEMGFAHAYPGNTPNDA
jgi:hypothetical protein